MRQNLWLRLCVTQAWQMPCSALKRSKCCVHPERVCAASSDIRLPTGGELHIFSPAAVRKDRACERDCMYLGAHDVPHSHKLTTTMMTGPS